MLSINSKSNAMDFPDKRTRKFDKTQKQTKIITGESILFPGVKLTINTKLDNVSPQGNPKKMADAKRILSNLKGPLPWDKR